MVDLPDALAAAIRTLGRQLGVTPFTVLLAACYVLLHRLSGQTDIVIGTPVSGREDPDAERLIGLFAATAVLRADLSGDPPFHAVLAQVRRTLLEALTHQGAPLAKLIELARPDRNTTYTPLVQVLFSQPPPIDRFSLGGLEITPFFFDTSTALFDLLFVAIDQGETIHLSFEANADQFDAETLDEIVRAYQQTLELATRAPQTTVSSFPLEGPIGEKAAARRSPEHRETLAISSTFAAEPVEEVLAFWMRALGRSAQIRSAPLNQVFQQLLDPDGLFATNHDGVNILLVRLSDLDDGHAKLDDTLQALADALRLAIRRSGTPHVVCICPEPAAAADSSLKTPAHLAAETRLAAAVGEINGASLIDTRELESCYPGSARAPRPDGPDGPPFGPLACAGIGSIIARRINALRQESAKVVVVDCDGTLWKGICGEDGPRGVEIDSARRRLQDSLVERADSGILVCLCSRNNEADVFATFEAHPEMPLGRRHLAAWRINWAPKSENLRSLAGELGLRLSSVVFLDDDAAVCAEVAANCPEAIAIRLPDDPRSAAGVLRHVWPLDRAKLTAEDRARTDSYRQNTEREQLRSRVTSLREFLDQLEVQVALRPLSPSEIPRASQLSWRTNQFNLTTLRRTEPEMMRLAASPRHTCLGVHVADRFGDYGLAGLVITREEPPRTVVDTFLLSCRVLGRGVEHQVLRAVLERARAGGFELVVMCAVPTPANTPVREFLAAVGHGQAQETGGAIRCEFPVDFDLPDATAGTGSPPAVDPARARAKDVSSRGARGPNGAGGCGPAFWSHVATDLATVEQIAAAVERDRPWRARPQTSRPYRAPVTETERRIAAIWREALHVEQAGLDDSFFDLGGHSLLAVRVVTRVREAFRVELPLRRLFESPTIGALAEAIDGLDRGSGGETRGADQLETDARLDPGFTLLPGRAAASGDPARILLSGAGGFLGAFLLRELLDRTDAQILCLMRESDRDAARERLVRNLSRYSLDPRLEPGRLVPVPGDLSLPGFGLADGAFEELAGRVDAIYHAAAVVNFLHPYATLRSANVAGTLEMLKLAARSKTARFHYVSTLGVLGVTGGDAGVHLERDVPDRYGGPDVGYFQSKWVAERLVLQARDRGLPVAIYRPGVVAGDSRAGVGSATDLFGMFMRALLQTGVAPVSDALLDVTPVDYVAAAVVRISTQPGSCGSVFHLANPAPARFSDAVRWIGAAGCRLRTVPPAEWLAALGEQASRDPERSFTAMLPHLAGTLLPDAGGPFTTPRYDCRRTLAALAGSGIVCPPVDAALMGTYLRAWTAAG